MSGQHARLASAGRRSFVLLSGATVLGLWFGLRAPDVTPVAVPGAVVQPADQQTVTPVVPPPDDGRPGRGGRR